MGERRHNPAKEQFWRRVMSRFRGSGLTIRAFCDRERLSEPSFYAWRAELARRDRAQRQRVDPVKPRAACRQPRFVPVRILDDEEPRTLGAIEILLRGGRIVRVTPGFDGATLAQAVAVLEASSC